jgi:TPP-dependent pyruvate/acetoin dehydrogenase alpha subunit
MEAEKLISILKKMILIRRFEERVATLAENNEFQDPVHLYVGQEAIASSVCEALGNDDYVYSTHRSHGHYLAKGGNVKKLMAEIFCRETGCSNGRGY